VIPWQHKDLLHAFLAAKYRLAAFLARKTQTLKKSNASCVSGVRDTKDQRYGGGCEKQLDCGPHGGACDTAALRRWGEREANFPSLAVLRQAKADVTEKNVRAWIGNAQLNPLPRLKQGSRFHLAEKRHRLHLAHRGPALIEAEFGNAAVSLKSTEIRATQA